MNQQSKILIIILIIFIGGGIFAWQYFGSPEEEVKDKTANWKTYRNESMKFEIKYPNGWEIGEEPLNVSFTKIFRKDS